MATPTLDASLIKLIFQDLLLRENPDNFEHAAKIVVAGQEGLNAFITFLQEEVQCITLLNNSCKFFTSRSGIIWDHSLPLHFWRQVVPHVPALRVHGACNGQILDEILQSGTSLSKAEVLYDIGPRTWRLLFASPVRHLAIASELIHSFNELKDLNIQLDHLELLHSADESGKNRSETLKAFFGMFHLPCQSLLLQWNDDVEAFKEMVNQLQHTLVSNYVEHLEISIKSLSSKWIDAPLHEWNDYNLGATLVHIKQIFPELKQTTLNIDMSTETPNFRYFPYSKGCVKALVDKVRSSVKYVFSSYLRFNFKCTTYVVWDNEDRESLMLDFYNNGFELAKNSEDSLLFVYSDVPYNGKKILTIEYKIAEFRDTVERIPTSPQLVPEAKLNKKKDASQVEEEVIDLEDSSENEEEDEYWSEIFDLEEEDDGHYEEEQEAVEAVGYPA